MNPRQRKEWKRIRGRGFGRYVLLNGIVWWGIWYSTISTLFKLFYTVLFSYPKRGASDLMWEGLSSIVFFSVFGSIVAIVRWVRNEDKYFWATDVRGEGGLSQPVGTQKIE
jgi:hypothetical protein